MITIQTKFEASMFSHYEDMKVTTLPREISSIISAQSRRPAAGLFRATLYNIVEI